MLAKGSSSFNPLTYLSYLTFGRNIPFVPMFRISFAIYLQRDLAQSVAPSPGNEPGFQPRIHIRAQNPPIPLLRLISVCAREILLAQPKEAPRLIRPHR